MRTNKEMPQPQFRDVFFSGTLYTSYVGKPVDLYKLAKNIPIDPEEGFVSVKYSKKIINESGRSSRVMFVNPPEKIPPHAQCTYTLCRKSHPDCHKTSCRTPFKEFLIISKDGMSKNSQKVEYILTQKGTDPKKIEEIVNGRRPVKYSLIFPGRGRKPRTKTDKRNTLDNLLSITYVEGKTKIVIRVSKKLDMNIVSAPFSNQQESFKLAMKLFREIRSIAGVSPDRFLRMPVLDISVLKGNFNVLGDDPSKELDLDVLDERLSTKKHLKDYKYKSNLSLISFRTEFGKCYKAYTEIRVRGNVKILLSKDKDKSKTCKESLDNQALRDSVKTLPKEIFDNGLAVPSLDSMLPPKKNTNITKIHSKGGAPKACKDIKRRPKPYTFRGECPEKGYVNSHTGVTKKGYDLYEPCCIKLTGKGPSKGKKFNSVNDMIRSMTGKRKIYARRMVYGFPNNLTDRTLFVNDKDTDSPGDYRMDLSEKGVVDKQVVDKHTFPGSGSRARAGIYHILHSPQKEEFLKKLLKKLESEMVS